MADLDKMAHEEIFDILPLKTMTVPPYTSTNTVIYGQRSFVVIDPGTADEQQQEKLDHYIKKRLHQGHRFLSVCLTHHHGDHVKSAMFLAKNFNVAICAHENAVRHLKFPIDQVLCHEQNVELDNGLALTAIHTPGHSDDHLVFFDRRHGVLIAGDMITDRGTVLIPPTSGSLKAYLESLDVLIKLPTKIIIPAHGTTITENPKGFLIKAIKHRYERILAVLDTLISEIAPIDATDITLTVYRNLTSKDLLIFAQLSVESSLAWLLEAHLVTIEHYKWRALPDDNGHRREQMLLRPLKEINERLRNA